MSGSKAGEINGWQCGRCDAVTYAIHVDDGVTPMFLGCRATDGCEGTGASLMYPPPPVPAHVLEAVAWEWFKPTGRYYRRLSSAMKSHVDQGGLDLRPLTDVGRELVEAQR